MSRRNFKIDPKQVKLAAHGQWSKILQTIGGLTAEQLDPQKNQPCPKCGGTDRFNAFKDVAETGGVNCRKCHAENNSDGFSTLQWMTGKPFLEVVTLVFDFVGGTPAAKPQTTLIPRIVETYDYHDETGSMLFQVVRFEPKDFRQRKPIPGGGWDWKVKGVPIVPYGLPELLVKPDETIFICEGEKDVNALRKLGLLATCNAGGAKKWKDEHSKVVMGRSTVILPDNDVSGRAHAERTCQSLLKHGCKVKVCTIPIGKDASDWIAAGATKDDFLKLVEAAKEVVRTSDSDGQPKGEEKLEPGTVVCARDRGNYGKVVHDDGGETVQVHFVSRDGVHATKSLLRTELLRENGSAVVPKKTAPIISAGNLIMQYPTLRSPVIHGIARVGEVVNMIAAPKMGKSFAVGALALAVATQRDWMGFPVEKGRVLIVDNELHPQTIAYRLRRIGEALNIPIDEYANSIDICCARGYQTDLHSLSSVFQEFNHGKLKLVIIDAWYRALPVGTDENDNADMAEAYSLLDSYAMELECAVVLIHHASKGNQSAKAVTDVGSGAGSQSRAADTHLILRPHREPGIAVLEAVVRSWPAVEPRCLRWTFPIWTPADDLNPADMKQEKAGRPSNATPEQVAQRGAARIREELEKALTPLTSRNLRMRSGLNSERFEIAFSLIRSEVEPVDIKAKNGATYPAWKLKT